MFLGAVKMWFSRATGLPPLLEPGLAEAIERLPETEGEKLPPARLGSVTWPADRMAIADLLWEEGFIRPGGAPEVVRLGRPLTGTSSSSLLLLGAGPGGAALSIAAELGVWVTAFEQDEALVAAAIERTRRHPMSKRVQTRSWDPQAPEFGPHTYHHAICLEPLRGASAVPVLTACAQALRPAANVVMTELVADEPLGDADPAAATWTRLEGRQTGDLPTEREITRALGRLGYDVRVVEDITERHVHLCLLGWRVLVRELRRDNLPPARAMWMVREAELWLNRVRLMQENRLRLVRWHAIGRPAPAVPLPEKH